MTSGPTGILDPHFHFWSSFFLSFFEEDDEPTRRTPRPRRARPAGGAAIDPQQIWVRRGVAAGFGVLVLVLLVLGARACQSSAQKSALKDYNREVGALVQQSDEEIGRGFFQLFQQAGNESPGDLQTGISGFKEQAETLLGQAQRVSTPDEMVPAQRNLITSLGLRRDGLQFIAERVTLATGDQGDAADQAIQEIAGQMQAFLASDVLIKARVTPLVKAKLDEAKVSGQTVVVTKNFLPDAGWLDPAAVANALGTQLSAGGRTPGEVTPGLHGTGLLSVAVGNVTLQPGVANRVPVSDQLVFAVKFANQGDNDEFDIKVTVRLTGPSKISASKTVDKVASKAEATANVTLPKAPRAGEVYTVAVSVAPVPGEQKTDNNKQTYQVLFTQ
jgi:hypothetical protein